MTKDSFWTKCNVQDSSVWFDWVKMRWTRHVRMHTDWEDRSWMLIWKCFNNTYHHHHRKFRASSPRWHKKKSRERWWKLYTREVHPVVSSRFLWTWCRLGNRPQLRLWWCYNIHHTTKLQYQRKSRDFSRYQFIRTKTWWAYIKVLHQDWLKWTTARFHVNRVHCFVTVWVQQQPISKSPWFQTRWVGCHDDARITAEEEVTQAFGYVPTASIDVNTLWRTVPSLKNKRFLWR